MQVPSRYRCRLWLRRARPRTLLLAALAAAILASCGAAQITPPPTATPLGTPLPRASAPGDYLALGDSITFGYVSHPSPAPGGASAYAKASNFVGYPAFVAQTIGLTVSNASCPGETSNSLIDSSAADNGCHAFRAAFPLHVSYPGESQLQFAESFIKDHRLTTQLVSIMTGGNDGLLVVQKCGTLSNSSCIDPLVDSTVSTLQANLTKIVQAVRGAGFNETIVMVNYYAFNYQNTAETHLVQALNSAISNVATANHLPLADIYTAFQRAAARTSGNTCATGLIAPGSSAFGSCDLHPSLDGQHLIAEAVAQATVS